MGQYWTRKGDQEDQDERTVCPWTEIVGHGDRRFPDPKSDVDTIHTEEDRGGEIGLPECTERYS